MRKLILNIHLFTTLIVGVFIAVLGVTGSILAFEPELDRALHPKFFYVKPSERVLSLAEIGDAAIQKYPADNIVAYLPPASPNLSTQVVLSRGIAYVNQHTGEVLGLRRGSFLGLVRSLHLRLAAGALGRSVLKWSTVAMLFLLVTGLWLWWPIRRVRIRGKWGTRRLWFDLHNATGVFSLLFLVTLAGTGVVLGFESQLAPLMHKLAGGSSSPSVQGEQDQPHMNADAVNVDQALALAQSLVPGTLPYRVQMPDANGFYEITFVDAKDRITGYRNSVEIDPRGRVLAVNRSQSVSGADRLLAVNEAIHTGTIWGLPSRIVACLASSMVLVQILTGLTVWLYRKQILRGPASVAVRR